MLPLLFNVLCYRFAEAKMLDIIQFWRVNKKKKKKTETQIYIGIVCMTPK